MSTYQQIREFTSWKFRGNDSVNCYRVHFNRFIGLNNKKNLKNLQSGANINKMKQKQ